MMWAVGGCGGRFGRVAFGSPGPWTGATLGLVPPRLAKLSADARKPASGKYRWRAGKEG